MRLASQRALVLLGSPRPRGASAMLADFLAARLAEAGCEIRRLPLTGLLQTDEGRAKLVADAAWADLCLLASPVYVDAPPAPVVRALEFLAEGEPAFAPGARFAAVFVCGFPEASHTALSLEMCRLFARRAGLAHAGGVGVGGGAAFAGKPLEARGAMAARLRRGLALAGSALAGGEPVPDAAVRLAAGPHIGKRLYLLMGALGMLAQARKRRTLWKLRQTPFAQP